MEPGELCRSPTFQYRRLHPPSLVLNPRQTMGSEHRLIFSGYHRCLHIHWCSSRSIERRTPSRSLGDYSSWSITQTTNWTSSHISSFPGLPGPAYEHYIRCRSRRSRWYFCPERSPESEHHVCQDKRVLGVKFCD